MGTFMTNLGLGTLDDKGEMLHKDLKEKLGLLEYQKLIEEADKETKDLDKRYELYAKADALLIEKALYIPKSMQARGELVSKVVPFTRSYSQVGLSMNKYKGMKIQSEPVTTEQYNKALADWEKAVKESATK